MKTSLRLSIAAALFAVLLYVGSCKKGTGPTEPTPPGGTTVTTTISGFVNDEFGNPIAGGIITSHGRSTSTGDNGEFFISNASVPASRILVACTSQGYFPGSQGAIPVANGITQIRIIMSSSGTTHTMNSASGGNATLNNGSQVQLPANGVVNQDGSPYSGTVNLAVKYFDSSDPRFPTLIPGGDLAAQTSSGVARLFSYGIMNVQLTGGSGQALRLASGMTSTLTMKIPSSLVSSAPGTIPLWYYKDSTGLWIEEGSATKQGDKYVGTVTHYTPYNCDDVFAQLATICGRVVDASGRPVPGVTVSIGQWTVVSGSDGRFCVTVNAGATISVRVDPALNLGVSSTQRTVGPFNVNTTNEIGDLVLTGFARLSGVLLCNTNPTTGAVYIRLNNSTLYSSVTGVAGAFEILVPPTTSVALVAVDFSSGRGIQLNIQTPRVDSTLNVGALQLCSSATVQVVITSPANGSTVTTSVVVVSGTVSDNSITSATLITNGRQQQIAVNNGSFVSSTVLSGGPNTIRVTAANAQGVIGSAQISVTFQGTTSPLRANLVWNTTGTDIDLHMINPSGIECFYGAPNVGGMRLDVDNTSGYGPENITVNSPINGTYTVRVQNYRNTVATTATVRIFKNETLIDTKSYTFSTTPPQTYWVVGSYTLP